MIVTFDEAKELCSKAYGPQKINDDAPLLCYKGRIARARNFVAKMGNSDPTKKTNLLLAINMLGDLQKEAIAKAEAAASKWASENLDKDPNSVYPPVCECEGCRIGDLQNEARNFLAEAGELRHQLLIPSIDNPEGKPLLFGFVDEEGKAEALALAKSWVSKLKEYARVKSELGEPINWQRIYGERMYDDD